MIITRWLVAVLLVVWMYTGGASAEYDEAVMSDDEGLAEQVEQGEDEEELIEDDEAKDEETGEEGEDADAQDDEDYEPGESEEDPES